MPAPCQHVFTVLCQIVSRQYSSRSSIHRMAGLYCHSLLSYGLQMMTRQVHRSSLTRVMTSAHDYFIFFTHLNCLRLVSSLCPGVVICVIACDVENTSFHFGICGRKFVLCLFGECPCLAALKGCTHASSGIWQRCRVWRILPCMP